MWVGVGDKRGGRWSSGCWVIGNVIGLKCALGVVGRCLVLDEDVFRLRFVFVWSVLTLQF